MFFQEGNKGGNKIKKQNQKKQLQKQNSALGQAIGDINQAIQNENGGNKKQIIIGENLTKEQLRVGDKFIYTMYTGISPIKKQNMERSSVKFDNKQMMSSYLKRIKNNVNAQNKRNSISGNALMPQFNNSKHKDQLPSLNNSKKIREVESSNSSQYKGSCIDESDFSQEDFDAKLILNQQEKKYLSSWKEWKNDFKRKNHIYTDPKKYSRFTQSQNAFRKDLENQEQQDQDYIIRLK